MGNKIYSYKDLIVWQKAIDLVENIYKLTENYPKEELFGLTSQMRRAAVSIPSNIAEGKYRGSRKDYKHFLQIAFASAAELETQLVISKKLTKTKNNNFKIIEGPLDEILKMLNRMIFKLKSNTHNLIPNP